MPTLPWTTAETPVPGAEVVVLGSRLELRTFRHIPGFMRAAMSVRRQVRGSRGALGVSLIAQPVRKRFWTLSAWTDQGALDAFVATAPHAQIMERFRGRLADAEFTTWRHDASELPKQGSAAKPLWREATTRLAGPKSPQVLNREEA
jgi:hypothetical protein